jgi:hypothetical protein
MAAISSNTINVKGMPQIRRRSEEPKRTEASGWRFQAEA